MNQENSEMSSIDSLKAFADKTQRKIFVTEDAYPSNAVNPVVLHRRTLYMPCNTEESSFLVGFTDPKSFGENALYFGVFFPFAVSKTSNAIARKKDILDKINLLAKHKPLKTGNDLFDSKIYIAGNDENILTKCFSRVNVQQLVLETMAIENGINISINAFEIDFVPALKNKTAFGIFTRMAWITDENLIEALINKAEQFRKIL